MTAGRVHTFATGNTPVCGWRPDGITHFMLCISSWFSSNSEAPASELPENHE